MSDGFGVTAISKLKHAALYRAAKKLGSQAALARHLNVHQVELGNWCNLRSTPSKSWPIERLADIEQKLFALTGETWEQLFPEELTQAKDFLKASKTVEATKRVEVAGLVAYAARQAERLSHTSPSERAEQEEVCGGVTRALKCLRQRERTIITKRYGIDCDRENIEQIADGLGLTRARVYQIEKRALARLRASSDQLLSLLDG